MLQINYSEVKGRPQKSLKVAPGLAHTRLHCTLTSLRTDLVMHALSTSALCSGGHLNLRRPVSLTAQWNAKLLSYYLKKMMIIAYWLADTSTLLVLLQHRATVLLDNTIQAVRLATLFHRRTQGTPQKLNLSPVDGDSAGVLDTLVPG